MGHCLVSISRRDGNDQFQIYYCHLWPKLDNYKNYWKVSEIKMEVFKKYQQILNQIRRGKFIS